MNGLVKGGLCLCLIGSLAGALSGCAEKRYLLPESRMSLAQAQTLIDGGEAKIAQGDTMVRQGKDMQRQGDEMIAQGERLREQGNEEIARGKQHLKAVEVLEEAEKLRQKGQAIQDQALTPK